MTEQDQITLYSCHLCGFCETSLSALSSHTATHIKLERANEYARERAEAINGRISVETDGSDVLLVDMQNDDVDNMDTEAMMDQPHSGQDIRPDGGSSRGSGETDDDDVVVVHGNLKSPQVSQLT